MRGGSPAMKCRSEPLRWSTSFRYSSIRRGTYVFAVALLTASVLLMVLLLTRREVELRQDGGVGHEFREQTLVARIDVGVVGVDLLRLHVLQQRLVEHLHAEVFAGLQL